MTLESIKESGFDFASRVERAYVSLIASRAREFSAQPEAEPSLGGCLLYAGEFDSTARALLVAANIAGAASLAATADAAAQKQAIREGVADFLVTSLEEALRILKNEVRKREPVAVCIAADPLAIEAEMLERGVLPDILPPASTFSQGRRRLAMVDTSRESILLSWSVGTGAARWLPKIDPIAVESIDAHPDATSRTAHRWLRLAPRYLGRLAHRFRLLRCSPAVASDFRSRVESALESKEIGVPVRVSINGSLPVQFDPSS